MLADFELEQQIIAETREWSAQALEIANPNYNGLPACPFAKKAWSEDRVGITFKYDADWQHLYKLISQWDDTKDVVVLIDFAPLSLDELDEYLDKMNNAIAEGLFINRDMFLMGFHPDDDENEFLDDEDFISTVDTSYAMIFLQRLSKLQEASEVLRQNGYYQDCEEYYGNDVAYGKRQKLYRRLKGYDEKS